MSQIPGRGRAKAAYAATIRPQDAGFTALTDAWMALSVLLVALAVIPRLFPNLPLALGLLWIACSLAALLLWARVFFFTLKVFFSSPR